MKKLILILTLSLFLYGCNESPKSSSNEQPSDQITDQSNKNPVKPLEGASTSTEPISQDPSPEKDPITVAKFFDFGCGYCRKGAQTMKRLEAQYGDKIDVQLMHFIIHPQVNQVHKASLCAGEQNQFKPFFYDYFENHYGVVDDKGLSRIAQSLDLNMKTYQSCLRQPMNKSAQAHKNLGSLLGVTGTPFFLINGKTPLRGAAGYEQFTTLIDQALTQ